MFVIFKPGRDGGLVPAGLADSEDDAYDIVYQIIRSDTSLRPEDLPIFQTPLNRRFQWCPVAPMPPDWRPKSAPPPPPPPMPPTPYGIWW